MPPQAQRPTRVRVESTLDDYVAGWRSRREAVCAASERADAAIDELRARAACLEVPEDRALALFERQAKNGVKAWK